MKKLFLILICFVICMKLETKASTNVSGGIYTNTIWTLINSPYVITDTVVIFPGVTLTIEPGVEVRFVNNMVLENRQGTLIANGTATDSISFTSNASAPVIGNFTGIYCNNSHIVVFNYCNFYWAKKAIYGNADSININNSNFRYNIVCFYAYLGGRVYWDSSTLLYNTIGIEGSTSTLMKNCTISYNQKGIDGCEGLIIEYSTVATNSVFGIATAQHDSIRYNVINNNGIGIKIQNTGGGSASIVHNNQVENNSIGMEYEGGVYYDLVYCNKICNNTYDVSNASPSFTDIFKNNYWCSTDTVVIASHINDGYDNANLGILDFTPIDTSSCYLTGCSMALTFAISNATCDTCQNGGASVNVFYGFQPYTYTWYTSPIQSTSSATGLNSGYYTVCVTDANGCNVCDSLFVDSTNCTGFSIMPIGINTSCSLCSDGIAYLNINGGAPPYNYTWYSNPIQITDTAVGLSTGKYFVCVSDLYGCLTCDSVNISTGNCSAHFNLYPDSIAHQYTAVNLASGIAPLSYSWNWGDGSAIDTIPLPTHLYGTPGFYNICLAIIDSAGCSDSFCSSFYLLRTNQNNTMIQVNVVGPSITDIYENKETGNLIIYPNPTFGKIFISGIQNEETQIRVFNPIGNVEFYYEGIPGNNFFVDMSNLPSGIHYITMQSEKQKSVKKIFLQR